MPVRLVEVRIQMNTVLARTKPIMVLEKDVQSTATWCNNENISFTTTSISHSTVKIISQPLGSRHHPSEIGYI